MIGWVVLLVGLIVAGIIAIVAVRMWLKIAQRHRTWPRAQGEATGQVWDNSGENARHYWRLRWTGADGVVRECVNPYGTSWGALTQFPVRGITVLIDPSDPSRAQVADQPSRDGRLFTIILMIFATIIVVVSGIFFAVSQYFFAASG